MMFVEAWRELQSSQSWSTGHFLSPGKAEFYECIQMTKKRGSHKQKLGSAAKKVTHTLGSSNESFVLSAGKPQDTFTDWDTEEVLHSYSSESDVILSSPGLSSS